MGALSIWHWLIVLAVVLLLFGSKKLPDAARGLGRSMRIFKSEPQALTQAQPNAAQYVQPQSQQPAPAPAPQYQQPVSQPQPHPQQHRTPAAPQQPQQHSDPTAPYQGGQGQ